jgi:flagellar biosynthesis/type III secretory pathway M-ring protein FliF/YscJ
MSLAVLVDQEVTWEPDKNGPKRVLVPPTPEKLKVIRDLVAGVTGFSAERGDQIVIDTLPFESTLLLEAPQQLPVPSAPVAPASPFASLLKMERKTQLIVGGVALAVVILSAAGVFFMRRRARKKKAGAAEVTGPAPLAAGPGTPGAPGAPAMAGIEQQLESKLAERDALQQKLETQALNSLKIAPVITKASEVLAKHLREKVSKEPELSAQMLHTWIQEEEA